MAVPGHAGLADADRVADGAAIAEHVIELAPVRDDYDRAAAVAAVIWHHLAGLHLHRAQSATGSCGSCARAIAAASSVHSMTMNTKIATRLSISTMASPHVLTVVMIRQRRAAADESPKLT